MFDTPRLVGKRVLLTGTGGGQGALAHRAFCEQGANVIGCDLQEGRAEAVAETLRQEGLNAWGCTVDLGDSEAACAWVEWGVAQLGGLDVLYNNASSADFAPMGEMALDVWEFCMRNELDSLFYVTAAAWKPLTQGGGSIINIASVAGLIGNRMLAMSAHSATKGAVIGLTRQLAAEGGPHGIRANAISPGVIATPATADLPPELRDHLLSQQMLDRIGTPEDVVPLAVYLASDESSFVTGANFVVDGGWTAGAA